MRCKAGRVVREADPYGGVTRSAGERDDVGIVPYGGLQEVQWAGDRKGRPYESVTRGAVKNPPVTALP